MRNVAERRFNLIFNIQLLLSLSLKDLLDPHPCGNNLLPCSNKQSFFRDVAIGQVQGIVA